MPILGNSGGGVGPPQTMASPKATAIKEIAMTMNFMSQSFKFDEQPAEFTTRCVDAGAALSLSFALRGRGTNSPLQLGQIRLSKRSEQSAQKVHSKEQILAIKLSGARSALQHSQLGRNSNICRIS